MENLWSLKPGTSDVFLQEIKLYQEMALRSRQDEWTLGVLGKEDAGPKSTTAGSSGDVRMEEMEKMFGELMKVMRRPTGQRTNKKRQTWIPDGRLICFNFKKRGHWKLNCPQ